MASCSARVSAPCPSRGHVRGRASRLGRPHRVECPARGSRRGGLAATASGPDAAADVDEAAAALVAWATADGLRLSPKVAVGAPFPGAPRGLVATQDIESGETVLTLPASCTAFDAAAARADETLGLGAGIAAYESAPRATRGADVSEETALALFVALARRHPSRTNFGAYVQALPAALPESPLFMDEGTFRSAAPAMPLSLIDAADDARADLFFAWDVAAAVADLVPGEPELGLEEFQWAWASVRSRAITFRVARGDVDVDETLVDAPSARGKDGEEDSFPFSNASATKTAREVKKKTNRKKRAEKDLSDDASASRHSSRRCLVPVVDMMNHACRAFPGSAASEAAFPGPAVTAAPTPEEDPPGVAWRAARRVKKGEEITWTYGADLSNEHLWLHYGFVPDPPVHAGCAVTFSFPARALLDGVRAVAAEDDETTAEKRFALLERCGLVDELQSADFASADEGEKKKHVGEREGDVALQFTVTLGERPGALAGIAGVACCAPEEIRAMHEGVFSSTSTTRGSGKTEKETEKEKRDCVCLCPESRRRAGRYVAFLLARVAPTATGGDVAAEQDDCTDETETSPARAALAAATRAREGARAAFRWLEPALENETLLEDGAWIEDAVAAAVLT